MSERIIEVWIKRWHQCLWVGPVGIGLITSRTRRFYLVAWSFRLHVDFGRNWPKED